MKFVLSGTEDIQKQIEREFEEMEPNKYKLNELLNLYLDLYKADLKFRLGFEPGEVILSEYTS